MHACRRGSVNEPPSSPPAAAPARRIKETVETTCRFLQQTLADAEPPGPAADHAVGALGVTYRTLLEELEASGSSKELPASLFMADEMPSEDACAMFPDPG